MRRQFNMTNVFLHDGAPGFEPYCVRFDGVDQRQQEDAEKLSKLKEELGKVDMTVREFFMRRRKRYAHA